MGSVADQAPGKQKVKLYQSLESCWLKWIFCLCPFFSVATNLWSVISFIPCHFMQPQLKWALNCSLNHCQLLSQIQLEPCWRFSTPNQTHLHRVLFSRDGCERNGLNVGKKRDHLMNWIQMHISPPDTSHETDTKPKFDKKPSVILTLEVSLARTSQPKYRSTFRKQGMWNWRLFPTKAISILPQLRWTLSLFWLWVTRTHTQESLGVASVDRIDLTWGVGKAWKLLDVASHV